MSAKGCEAAQKQATLILPGAPCLPVLLPVPGRSRTSPLLQKARNPGQAKLRPVRTHNALLPGGRADLSAKGCEAAQKQATLILPGAPCLPVLLPVPGSSRTSPLLQKARNPGQAKLRPVRTHNALLPGGRGSGLVREGLRSGPRTGHLDFTGCTVLTCFAAGSRQFADKRSVARSAAESALSGLHNLRTELEREVTHNAPTASSTAPESAIDARHCPTPIRC
ncbi:Uncharacterized protein ALO84_04518 [Pseudomonas syringae pv. maculicola]|nr:Uncharacterized protein ALO84_04518 [Pseudomonas syringae pv. maculicola]